MDVKKLIVGFLILATAAGTSAFIVSVAKNTSDSNAAAGQATLSQTTAAGGNAGSGSLGTNAFLGTDGAADAGAIVIYGPTSTVSSSDPNNLTGQLASAFVSGVVAANPDGLTDDASGSPTLTAPDTQTVAQEVANLSATANITIPNWDTQAASLPVKIATSSTPAAITNYSTALNNILDQHFVSTGIQSMENESTEDPSQVAPIETQIQGAISDAEALAIPASLTDLQKSFLTSLVYEKNMLLLAENSASDPVKTSLIMEGEQDKYNAAIQNFTTEMQKASAIQGFSLNGPTGTESNSKVVAMVDQVLGIQTANAQWVVFDGANFGEWLEKFAQDIALQIAKNALVATIQKEVLTAIQGSGAPEFVQQWGTTLVNAYEQTALSALNGAMQCINPAFAPQIKLNVGAFYKPNNNLSCVNSLQNFLGSNSVQQFYNNFTDGGFLAYGATLLPSGNYYGGLAFAADTSANAGQSGQQATQAKVTSAGGFTGAQACDDGSNPNAANTVCLNSNGDQVGKWIAPGASCPAGLTAVTYANDGSCADGTEPEVTTPGQFTGFSANSALDITPKQVTAANDIAGLLNAAANSLMSTLANTAIQAANNAVNQGLSGSGNTSGGILSINPSNVQGGGTPPAPTPLICDPSIQDASTTVPVTVAATGGTIDANGNLPTYDWSSSDGQTGTGYTFSPVYDLKGAYTITLSDSANDATSTCEVDVQ